MPWDTDTGSSFVNMAVPEYPFSWRSSSTGDSRAGPVQSAPPGSLLSCIQNTSASASLKKSRKPLPTQALRPFTFHEINLVILLWLPLRNMVGMGFRYVPVSFQTAAYSGYTSLDSGNWSTWYSTLGIFPARYLAIPNSYQIITAVLWRRPGHLSLKIPDKLIHFHHQGGISRGLVIPCQKQIETGPAPHGSGSKCTFAKVP